MSKRHAWRLLREAEWARMRACGYFAGSVADRHYMHLSPVTEVRRTLVAHYADVRDVWALKIDLHHDAIAPHVRWEHVPSRNAVFPHLYHVPLPQDAVVEAYPVYCSATGSPVLPPELALQHTHTQW